jgi:tetratricopeptide (TPR) repeat protein
MTAFEGKDYETAEECFAEALKKNDDKAEYYISYGLALMQNEKYEEALKQLNRAVIDKDNQIVLENNKAAYRGIGMVYYQMQEYEQAVEAFEHALAIDELSSVNRDIMLYLSECLEALGKYEEAIAYYEKILSIEKTAEAYAKKASLEKKNGDFEDAQEDYDQAISLEKEDYDLYFQKYYLLKEQGEEEEAEKVLEKAASIDPKTDGQKYEQSKLYYFLGKEKTAQKGFEEALEQGYAEAGFYLGQIAQKQGKLAKAEEYYINYIESGKKISSAAVYNQLGLCYMEQEEYEYARDTFALGMKLNDGSLAKELLFNQIIAYEHLGKYEKAYKKAQKYMEMYPEDDAMKEEMKFMKTRK